jgi:hypothetical protein
VVGRSQGHEGPCGVTAPVPLQPSGSQSRPLHIPQLFRRSDFYGTTNPGPCRSPQRISIPPASKPRHPSLIMQKGAKVCRFEVTRFSQRSVQGFSVCSTPAHCPAGLP